MKRNKFSKALKHLKSKKRLYETAPTNSMSGVYQVSPSTGDAFRLGPKDPPKRFYPKADGTWPAGIPGDANKIHYDRPAGYWGSGRNTQPEVGTPTDRDYSYGDVIAKGTTDTTTLIRASDGKVYTSLPPNTESFILGPVVTSYAINHGYDDYTNLGYIQKDTRQFVLLARIQGFFKGEDRPRTSYGGGNARTWDGNSSDLTIYNNNFTLEHALWMRETYLNGNFKANFPFNFAGGIPVERHPDNSGMGGGDILGTDDGKESKDGDSSGTEQDDPDDTDLEKLDLWGLIKKGVEAFGDFAADPLGAIAKFFGDYLTPPAAEYATNIAKSIVENEPIVVKQEDVPKGDIDKLIDGFNDNATWIPISVSTNGQETPYADENFYVDEKGNVNSNIGPNGEKAYYKKDTTGPVDADVGFAGYGNPLGAAGQAQVQVVTGGDGKDYILYTDHAYHNLESADPGEVPDPIKAGLSWLIHNVTGKGDSTKPNTGGMSGYPPNIKGDVKTEIKINLDDPRVSDEFRDRVNREKYYKELGITESSKLKGRSLKENKKRILREVKRPVLIEATPKTQKLKGYKPNFKGKFSPQNTPDVTASKKSDEAVHGYNTSRMAWTSKDKFWKGYETTERMNVIYDRVGFGQQYFDEISGENLRTKVKKKREVQEHLNQLAHQKAMREVYGVTEFQNKIDEAETYDNKVKDPLFAKVADRLKKEIDYANKPSPHGYPTEAPAKIDPKTGMHPKYGKRYKYDKLDPVSAVMMKRAPTGDPEIDANVKKAAQERKEHLEIDDKISEWMFGKLKRDWRKEIEEGMTTGNMLTAPIPPAGDEVFDDTPTTSADVFADAPARDPGFQYDALVGTAIKSSGNGSGDNGGFNIGNHVAFDGEGSADGARWCVLKAVDTTKLDTMVVRAITGNGSNGGETPDDAGEGLVLYYKTPEMYDYIPITDYPTLGDYKGGSFTIIPLGHGQSGLQDYQIKIPEHARKEGTRFLLYQFESSASGRDTYGITNISFRRQTPVNVVVPLDSPEAISFISVGVNEGDPKKRKKRVDDMLKASDEYTAKQMGGEFPGQGTKIDTSDPFAPSPLTDPDASPIGKDAVTKSFKDFSAQAEQEPEPEPTPPQEPSTQATLQPKDENGKEIEVKSIGAGAIQGADAAKLEAETETEPEAEVEPEVKPIGSGSVNEPEPEPEDEEEKKNWLQRQIEKHGKFFKDWFKEMEYSAFDVKGSGNIFDLAQGIFATFASGTLEWFKIIAPSFYKDSDWGKMHNNITIARAVVSGKVVNHVPLQHEIADFRNRIDLSVFEDTSRMYIPISSKRHEYADKNIYVLDGKVYNNRKEGNTDLTVNKFGQGKNFGPVDSNLDPTGGIGGHGTGYAQLIIPEDGGKPYVHYYDYNYHNLKNPDDLPIGGAGRAVTGFASDMAHLFGLLNKIPGMHDPALRAQKAFEEKFNNLGNEESFIGEGWPPGIHGAALTDFKIPVDALSEEVQKMIANHPLSWTPQRIANMTPEDFRNQGYERFERFGQDFKSLDAYVLKAMEDPDSVTDAEFVEYYKRYAPVEYDEKTGTHPGAEKGTVQYDYDKAVEELRKAQDNPDYNKASQAAFKEYEDILAERDKKIDEISEKYDTGKLWEKLVGPHYRAVQRATKGGGSISKNSPTYQKMIDGYNQYEKQSKVFEQRLSAERSALMDEYGKLSDEAYAKYNDTVQVRKLDDGTMGLVNGGDFKTKNGKVIPGMRTLTAKEQARFDEVRAEYDEVQEYLSSANWDRNYFQAFVLYDVKTQFAKFGISGDDWSPEKIGTGSETGSSGDDTTPDKTPFDRSFYAGTVDPIVPLGAQDGDQLAGIAGVVGGITAVATFLAMTLDAARTWWKNATPEQRQKIKELINNRQNAHFEPMGNPLLEKYAPPKGKVSLYEKLKTRGFFDPKDLKPTFPPNDPPEIDPKTKMHANYGKQAGRYKKLDPMSANAMPATGDPEIDAVVDKQRTGKTPEQKKKDYVKTASRIKKLAKKR